MKYLIVLFGDPLHLDQIWLPILVLHPRFQSISSYRKIDERASRPIFPSACNGCFRARQTTHWIGNDKNRVLEFEQGKAVVQTTTKLPPTPAAILAALRFLSHWCPHTK
ncbi:hypothetical protein AVEN_150058-1 [Araneus ventricosus]|uniref:Uncharacterized protein n=1 Tax=Araneus ventricosus TaxID=182803 RepID=A0A4Y2EVY0_ARAVE|nr:hypothetical protein AVEN_150058-1 [Araneus ventricosus]